MAHAAERFAAIDCGTNSIRLVISERCPEGQLRELNRDNIIVRLGEGVDSQGAFTQGALERVDGALGTYTQRMVDHGVKDVMMGATSATRDASNREEFFELTGRHLGRIVPGRQAEVISGEEEARLSFSGAVADLKPAPGERVCVIDLGGGSTEFVVGEGAAVAGGADASAVSAFSTNMGCVRITERFLHNDPPTQEEISEARAFVETQLEEVRKHVSFGGVDRVVGVAGTMTTTSAITQGLESYQPERIHLSELPLDSVQATAVELLNSTVAQRLEYGPMAPGRADVFGGGAIIIDAFASYFKQLGLSRITISEKDILDGMLARVLGRNT